MMIPQLMFLSDLIYLNKVKPSRNIKKNIVFFEPQKNSKINDFEGMLKIGGPYGTIYEPFFAGFEEIGSNYVVFKGSKIVVKSKHILI